jgi:hypothetical protein
MPRIPVKKAQPKFASEYDENVFINCPFDDRYLPLFHSIVFALHDVGFRPRCALEANNFGENRLDKIIEIIAECKYSIHDLSRTQVDSKTRFPRFNMPLELGLDLGCSRYGKPLHQEKVILVMDVEKFRYRNFISDIAGQEIYAHGGCEERVIGIIREWLVNAKPSIIPKSDKIYERYRSFHRVLPTICRIADWDIRRIPFVGYSYVVAEWLSKNPRIRQP